MKIAKFLSSGKACVGLIEADQLIPLQTETDDTLTQILEADNPVEQALSLKQGSPTPVPLTEVDWLPPIDRQEVWAAGVTYKRSQTARMEESEAAASCYDRVYQSPRPELFFKATPHRVSGMGQPVRIRVDAQWNVPEPEIALVLSSTGRLVGISAGNDMSSRDIEGDNPLYLPQAKMYDQCCGLGPWITLLDEMPDQADIQVHLEILRAGKTVFSGDSGGDQMAREFSDLMSWLMRDNSFPDGVFLLTGTGIVPDSDFTLAVDDIVEITISGVGTLSNVVVQG